MRFGVIVCPRCKRVIGVDLFSKTTKCIYCGRTLVLKKLKIFYETESQEKLQKAIGLINADLEGTHDAFKKSLHNKNTLKRKQFK